LNPIAQSAVVSSKFRWYSFLSLLLTLILAYFSYPQTDWEKENIIAQADGFLRDLKFRLRGSLIPSGDIVIVTIGEESIERVGEWPWKRRYQAALIDSIFQKGAKNIGLDIVWPERDASETHDNQLLQAVLKKYEDRITLAWMAQCLGRACDKNKDFSDTIENDPFFNQKIRSQGFVNASKSARGKIDKSIYYVHDHNEKFPSMPLATIAQRLNQIPEQLVIRNWSFINFQGRSGTLPRIEALCFFDKSDADCSSALENLKGKTVILGVSALGVGDQVATAYDKVVDGVEVQANIAEQILNHRIPYQSGKIVWFVSLLVGVVLLIACHQLSHLKLILIFSLSFFGGVALDLVCFYRDVFLSSAFFYINILSLAFSTLGYRFYQEFQQKQFLRSAFDRYLSPEVVKILMKNPEVLRLGGQKREITILFCDLRNFTSISEKLDPEALTSLLNEILTILTRIIFKHGGTVDKYIGDAVMAFFNAPLDQSDHAFLACSAAQEMIKVLEQQKESFKNRYGVDIKIGIGINTGEAHVGNLGSEQRFNYSALGDAVNIASRVETLTKEIGSSVLTTRATLDAIEKTQKAVPPFRSVGTTVLKGKSISLELFEILELS